jgi:hypothetical protein
MIMMHKTDIELVNAAGIPVGRFSGETMRSQATFMKLQEHWGHLGITGKAEELRALRVLGGGKITGQVMEAGAPGAEMKICFRPGNVVRIGKPALECN